MVTVAVMKTFAPYLYVAEAIKWSIRTSGKIHDSSFMHKFTFVLCNKDLLTYLYLIENTENVII